MDALRKETEESQSSAQTELEAERSAHDQSKLGLQKLQQELDRLNELIEENKVQLERARADASKQAEQLAAAEVARDQANGSRLCACTVCGVVNVR